MLKKLYILLGNRNSGRNIFGRLFTGYQPEINIDFTHIYLSSVDNMINMPIYSNLRKKNLLLVFSKMKKYEVSPVGEKIWPFILYENLPNYLYLTKVNYSKATVIINKFTDYHLKTKINNIDEYDINYIQIKRNLFVSIFTSFIEDKDYNINNINNMMESWKEGLIFEENNNFKVEDTIYFEDLMIAPQIILDKYLKKLNINPTPIKKRINYNKYITIREHELLTKETNLENIYISISKKFSKYFSSYDYPQYNEILTKGIK